MTGLSNLEKEVWDGDYQNALFSMNEVFEALVRIEDFENAVKVYWSWKRFGDDYVDFRLSEFDSEGRKVIGEVYKILGYNPNIPPKRLKE